MRITKTLKDLVKKEAKNLLKFATKEELQRLNINSLNPVSRQNCIYGQMTGNCQLPRSTNLITQCCAKVYVPDENENPFHDVDGTVKLNGAPVGNREISFKWFSPIEIFITLASDEQKANLVAYLRGERKMLLI